MRWLWLLSVGLLGGVLAGLGMGGGTLTIPLLVLALGVGQIEAQTVNLVAFLPTGCGVLFLHAKNGFVVLKDLLFVMLPATLFAIASSLFAVRVDAFVLRRVFGGFLVLVGMASLVTRFAKIVKIGYLH
ncbi:MAG: TSUP family transporter [Clostridia bacterium]|nr:TSUP family transporter [Clostridia bacterium]